VTPVDEVLIIGAGPCGLAIARQLRHQHGIDALVLDRAAAPAQAWRDRIDGFRLNTCGFWSHLPGQRIPREHGRWPGRDALVDYFDDYVRRQRLRVELGATVSRVDRAADGWVVSLGNERRSAAAVVVATGNYHTPVLPAWPGADAFTGELLHAAQYRNPTPFADRDVLVVGSGNSATDIAVELSGGVAARVRMACRTPPQLVPRAIAGIPIDTFSPAFTGLPVALLDRAAAVLQRLRYGDLPAAGLPAPQRGIYTALLSDGQVPTLGDQLAARIRGGRIDVVAAVEGFDDDRVRLADGTTVRPDAVIAATGYRRGLEPLVGHLGVLDDTGRPVVNGLPSAATGLWFAGYAEPLIGPLRSFRRQATPIAADIARMLRNR
jgi:putative flavoprotein involved in K+ transport